MGADALASASRGASRGMDSNLKSAFVVSIASDQLTKFHGRSFMAIPNRVSFLFFMLWIIAFSGVPAYAAALTVGNGGGAPGQTVDLAITVDAAIAPGIAGAAFTVTYNGAYLTLTRVSSAFFDTFAHQWSQLNPPPDPMPPDSVEVDGINHDQPLLSNTLAGVGVLIAAARARPGGTDATLFTLTFEIDAATPVGDYQINVVQTIIDNVDAGYPGSGAALDFLIRAIPDESDLHRAFPVIEVTRINPGVITVAPDLIDVDNDGIDDRWEVDHFGSLTTANQRTDYDKDRYSDLSEYHHDGELDPGGENLFDPKSVNKPRVARVDTTGGGDRHASLEAAMAAHALKYPNEPLFIKIIKGQQCNAAGAVVFDVDAFYYLRGGYGDDFTAPPEGFSSIDGAVTISAGAICVENIIIGGRAGDR